LPAQLAGKAPTAGRPVTVRVRLDGDGGGAWDLRTGDGALVVTPGAAADPDVTVHQTVADWKAIAVGEPGAVNLAPPQASPTDVLFLDPAALKMVQTIRGTVRFEVSGFNGRTWSLTVKLGGGDIVDGPAAPADATISVDAETYAQMLARTLPAPAAYFQGKIRLAGDANLAMQIGMALMPRFQ
jgi:putative sterol carrier protein